MPGLYIHLPFCKSKCAYCDFVSYAGRETEIDGYLHSLAREAPLRAAALARRPDTLYIGGGTPSFLSAAQITKLCAIVQKNFGPIKNFKESTFECNPESLTEAKLKLLRKVGFNRLSVGAQAMDDKCLKAIGRAHNKAQFLAAFSAAKKYFDNISVDIIAALPGQSLPGFIAGLKEIIALGPQHISVYGLQVEEGTPLYKSGYHADDSLCRAMLEAACKILQSAGFKQYEISNFARSGRRSSHNINYWRGGEYLGLGEAAASYINGVRSCGGESERLQGKAKLGEKIILGLRMIGGLCETEQIKAAFGPEIAGLIKAGLLERRVKNIRLTDEGKYMANQVWQNFVEPF